MNIPSDLKLIREASSVDAANALLAVGWSLITVAPHGAREDRIVYIFGWTQAGSPPEPLKPARTPGNLASDARQ